MGTVADPSTGAALCAVAKAARAASSEARDAARVTSAHAAELVQTARRLRDQIHHERGERVARHTHLVDARLSLSPSFARFVAQEAAQVGRDPAIDQAKALIAARYGVTGADAFELLRVTSQRRRMKVRDIARRIVSAERAPTGS